MWKDQSKRRRKKQRGIALTAEMPKRMKKAMPQQPRTPSLNKRRSQRAERNKNKWPSNRPIRSPSRKKK